MWFSLKPSHQPILSVFPAKPCIPPAICLHSMPACWSLRMSSLLFTKLRIFTLQYLALIYVKTSATQRCHLGTIAAHHPSNWKIIMWPLWLSVWANFHPFDYWLLLNRSKTKELIIHQKLRWCTHTSLYQWCWRAEWWWRWLTVSRFKYQQQFVLVQKHQQTTAQKAHMYFLIELGNSVSNDSPTSTDAQLKIS